MEYRYHLKRAAALTLCAAVLSGTPAVNAASLADQQSDYDGEAFSQAEDTVVTYAMESTFTVTIPKTIILDSKTDTASYSVNVSGDIGAGHCVFVDPRDEDADATGINFAMKDQVKYAEAKPDVTATVEASKTIWNMDEVNASTTAEGNLISATDLTSGRWKGTLTFDITHHVHDVPEDGEDFTGCATCGSGHEHEFVQTEGTDGSTSYICKTCLTVEHTYDEDGNCLTCTDAPSGD